VGRTVLLQVLEGTADANIRFADLRRLLLSLGFVERIKGSHHIFARPDVAEILNLQPRAARQAVSGEAGSRSAASV
jgi:predicted RNA binding protein YcfA (HicA-like mRNA interferase family)